MPRPLRKIVTFKLTHVPRVGLRAVGYDSRGRSVNYLEGDLTTTEAQMRRSVKQFWGDLPERGVRKSPRARSAPTLSRTPTSSSRSAPSSRAPSRRARKYTTLEQDTPLLAYVIGDRAVADIEKSLGGSLPKRDAAVEWLAKRADTVYEAPRNEQFRAAMRSAQSRERLLSYMRHWLAAWTKKNQPALFARLPSGWGWDS